MAENTQAIADGFLPDDFELAQKDQVLRDAAFETVPVGYLKDALIRFRRNKASLVAFVIICIIVVLSIIGPALGGYGYNEQFHSYQNMPPKIPFLARFGIADGSRVLNNRRVDRLQDTSEYPEGSILAVSPSVVIDGVEMVNIKVDYYRYKNCEETFAFGSDYLGRDIWARLWRGTRVSLFIAVVAALANLIVGVIYGSIAGYYGGKLDMVMMRICEIIQSFPRVVVVTLFILFFGTGLFSIIMALVIRDWIGTARIVRSQFYRFKTREYVLAARTLGVKDSSIMTRHILPNSVGPIITSTMFAIPSAIFAESFLAYIGMGLQAPEPSIGVMLSAGQAVLLNYPTQSLFPGLTISALMISFNLFANGLRDAMDPTQRGAE